MKGLLKRRQDVLGGVQCEARGAEHRSQEEVSVSAVRACDASDGSTCAIPGRSATRQGVYPLACLFGEFYGKKWVSVISHEILLHGVNTWNYLWRNYSDLL